MSLSSSLSPIIFLVLITSFTALLSGVNYEKHETLISPIPSITPELTLTTSPTPIITETPSPLPTTTTSITPSLAIIQTPSPTPTPTKTPIPSPAKSEEINSLINRFSIQYGIDPNILRHIAICESGFNSSATNGPYIGLFQFGSTTWQNLRLEIGENHHPDLRYSAEESIKTASYALSKNKSKLWPNCTP